MSPIQILRCLPVALLLFSSSCKSKPKEDSPPAGVEGKATNIIEPTRVVELMVNVSLAPRRPAEVQSAILLDKTMQNCLRAEFKDGTENLTLSIQGRLGSGGEIQDPLIITPKDSLKTCVAKRLKHLQLGQGKSGTFKMKVERAGPLEPGGHPAKTILLDLDDSKKLQ